MKLQKSSVLGIGLVIAAACYVLGYRQAIFDEVVAHPAMAMLTTDDPKMAGRPPRTLSNDKPTGVPIKVVHTVDGDVTVYRTSFGCQVYWRGVLADNVSLTICNS